MRFPLLLVLLVALVAGCAAPVSESATSATADPAATRAPQIMVRMRVTIDDTEPGLYDDTKVQWLDPRSGIPHTDLAIPGWGVDLGPFDAPPGRLWVRVDNRVSRAVAHCSIRVGDAVPVTADIPAGRVGGCSAPG